MSKAEPEFKFEKSQRVFLPVITSDRVQAVIVSRKSFLGREPEYELQYLASDVVTESGQIDVMQIVFAESVLVKAQTQETVTLRLDAEDLRRDLESAAASLRPTMNAARRRRRAAKAKRKR